MTVTEQMVLAQNLIALKLSTMVRNLDSHLRQARENSMDYDEFLLGLTEIELQVRSDNRFKRRMRAAKFPLLKTFEIFDFDATPDLDRRFIHELTTGEYIREYRNIIFLGKAERAIRIWQHLWPWRPANRECGPALSPAVVLPMN